MKKFGTYFLSISLGVGLYTFVAYKLKDFQAGDVGLGIATTSHELSWEGLQINQAGGNSELVLPAFKKFRIEGNKVVLLTGNSQLHAINYYHPGDQLAIYYLNELAREQSTLERYVQLSSPNINFLELLIYYLSLRQQDCKPDWVVVGATYRCFQFSSIRSTFAENLSKIDLDAQGLDEGIVKIYKEELNHAKKKATSGAFKTDQEKIEASITELTEDRWEAYRYIGNVRSGIKILPGMAYRNFFTNKNFYQGSEVVEQLNMFFLKELIRLCREDDVKVLIYQPPHPESGESFQYNQTKYDKCYEDIKTFASESEGIYFRDFENVVDLELWGQDGAGRLDVFHFKDPAHKELAKAIFDFFQSVQ